MKKGVLLGIFLFLFWNLSCFPLAFCEDDRRTQSYHMGIGDLLEVTVYDEPELSRRVRVLTDGHISFPLIGSIKASGLTVSQLEKEITDLLAAKYLVDPQVTVLVKEFSRIFILGEVKDPGSFPLYGKMTVFEAISLAGGFTELANPSKVKVIREDEYGQETSFEVNIDHLTKKGDISEDRELEANDRIVVPRRFF